MGLRLWQGLIVGHLDALGAREDSGRGFTGAAIVAVVSGGSGRVSAAGSSAVAIRVLLRGATTT